MPGEGGLHAQGLHAQQGGHVNVTCPRNIGVGRATCPGREGYMPGLHAQGGLVNATSPGKGGYMPRGYMPCRRGLHARGREGYMPRGYMPSRGDMSMLHVQGRGG